VIGTLGGALLGFVAMFTTALFKQRSEHNKAEQDRTRARLERIYELLIIINQEMGTALAQALSAVKNSRPMEPRERRVGPAPLIELEMLISLYFSDLGNERKKLLEGVGAFEMKRYSILHADFRKEPSATKDSFTKLFVHLNADVRESIEDLKQSVVKRVVS
jgi:hypothetical protein